MPFTPNINQLRDEVMDRAKRELAHCNERDTPYVCKAISTMEGKDKIVKQIVEYVSAGRTISQAIVDIDRENNPNTLD